MATLPEPLKEMLQDRVFVHLATLMPDGSPQVSPVWVDLDGDEILINTAQGRVKDRNMKRDPRVALSVTSAHDHYRAYMIRGHVTGHTTSGADAHIDRLSKKYLGLERYPRRMAGEVRVIFRIRADAIGSMG
jgi:PPOX class probable F420-dependent enzyme